ncbi:unnamed protein product, partial [Mesorhabditis belari]|uniref:Uncharacterized protein n=1 Tax=Mesorhabditis belari TaxID=2138241 RepID=A0AAF3FC00_9BILA
MEYSEEDWARARVSPPLHRVRMIRRRELGQIRPGAEIIHARRDFFRTIPLDHMVTVLERKQTYPVAWSPDGRFLVCFNKTMRTVHIHRYMGVEKAIGQPPDEAFKRVLPIVGEMTLYGQWMANALLAKDFALFTDDSQHIVVCASAPVGDNVSLNAVYRNNESLNLSQGLERYAFIVIDVPRVAMCDVYSFPVDRIQQNQGVSMRGRTLSVLSSQHQQITILKIDERGKIVPLKTIGPSVLEDDEIFLKIENGNFGRATAFLSAFKQKLFTFLYKRCKNEGDFQVHLFHRAMGSLRRQKMSKAHLLDDRHLIIRLSDENGFNNSQNPPFFSVIFDWVSGQVVHVFHVTDFVDNQYFKFFESFAEEMTTIILRENPFPWTASHCAPVNLMFRKIWGDLEKQPEDAVGNKTSDRLLECVRRLVRTAPWGCAVQPQSSPYLDPTLFFIDEVALQGILRGRFVSNQISWRVRAGASTQLLFFMSVSNEGFSYAATPHQLLSFHPEHPFALYIDRSNQSLPLTMFLPSGMQLDGNT